MIIIWFWRGGGGGGIMDWYVKGKIVLELFKYWGLGGGSGYEEKLVVFVFSFGFFFNGGNVLFELLLGDNIGFWFDVFFVVSEDNVDVNIVDEEGLVVSLVVILVVVIFVVDEMGLGLMWWIFVVLLKVLVVVIMFLELDGLGEVFIWLLFLFCVGIWFLFRWFIL